MDPGEELAGRLRAVHELSGRSLRTLARDAGISSSSLSRYLSGRTVPPWSAVVALCRVVGRDPRPLRRTWTAASQRPPAPPAPTRPTGTPVRAAAPNQLPFDVADFTGRERELAEVLHLAGTARAVIVDGMAGVGKTCLAVHAAHLLADRYPDGRLHLDLHGFTPGREPLDTATALRTLLTALDVPPGRIPDDVEGRAARWRAELAERRVLVLLDNVAGVDQARLLLPGGGSSAVLLTSRNRLVGLAGVPPVSLDVLPERDATELFARAGDADREAREPEAVAEVLRLCGRLPLAIRLAGARLRHRPGWTVAVLADRLRAGSDHFDTAFAMSVRQLDRPQRRLFGLLGLLPGPDFDEYAAAALGGLPLAGAAAMLEDLLDAHLVQQPAVGRHRLHDLVREHARRLAATDLPEPERQRALARLRAYYLHAAAAADGALPFLHRSRPPAGVPAPRELPVFDGRDAALGWFDREYANLLGCFDSAVAAGDDAHVGQLPRFLRSYFFRRAGTAVQERMVLAALDAARRLDDPLLVAEARTDVGFARYAAGRTAEADAEYREASRLAADLGDAGLIAELTLQRGYLRQDRGGIGAAMAEYRRAADEFERAGRPMGRAYALAYQGWALAQLGRYAEAAELARAALAVPHGSAVWPPNLTALVALGVAVAGDDPDAAVGHMRHALRLAREDGNRHNLAWCQHYLGVALRHTGRYDEALAAHRQAFDVLAELGEDQWAIDFLNGYGDTCLAAGRPADAVRWHRRALDLAPRLGYRFEEALAHRGLAAALRDTDPAAAAGHDEAYRGLLRELGVSR